VRNASGRNKGFRKLRLDTRDQLTAIARFFNDVWVATRAEMGDKGHERIRLAFGLWADAPSEGTWAQFVFTLRDLVGETDSEWMLSDLEPYLHRAFPQDPDGS
jgi:hypothetical protein